MRIGSTSCVVFGRMYIINVHIWYIYVHIYLCTYVYLYISLSMVMYPGVNSNYCPYANFGYEYDQPAKVQNCEKRAKEMWVQNI